MFQQIRTLIILSKGPSSVPSMHVWQLTTVCNSRFRESDVIYWPLQAPPHRDTHLNINKNKYFKISTVPFSVVEEIPSNFFEKVFYYLHAPIMYNIGFHMTSLYVHKINFDHFQPSLSSFVLLPLSVKTFLIPTHSFLLSFHF